MPNLTVFTAVCERCGHHWHHARTTCPDCGVWPGDELACQCDATVWALDF